MDFTVNPSYFFVAHCQVAKPRIIAEKLANLQKLAPTAKVNTKTSSDNQYLVTFTATFSEPVDFDDLRRKFSFYFTGKSGVLSIHHSATKTFPELGIVPTCFYSAYLAQNYTRIDQLNGKVVADQAKITAALALTGLSRTTRFTFSASEILLCSTEPFPPRAIIEITQVINTMRISGFLCTE